METLKTLADFKRAIKPGVKVKTTYHLRVIGRDEKGQAVYGDADMGLRDVATVNSVGFSCWTMKDGERRQSHCQWPKASEIEFNGNVAVISVPDTRGMFGDMAKAELTAPKKPCLTYEILATESGVQS